MSSGEHVRGASGDEGAPPVRDGRKLRMLYVDGDVRPLLQPERGRAVRRADCEQVVHREHVAPARLAARDPVELAQLLERVDAHVRVRADAEGDAAVEEALDGQKAVAEIRLRRRAGADTCAGGR